MEIIPAIIPKSAADLKEKLETVKGLADTAHVDVTENPPTFFPSFSKGGGKWRIFEAHLMVANPTALVPSLVRVGFGRIIVQIERLSAEQFAEAVHEWKHTTEVVPSLEIETPLDAIDSFAHELETVQLMGIAEIGAQGRPFDTRVIERVRALHAKYPHLTIAVDGGVNKENAEQLVAVGAARLVVGSALKEFYG